MMAEGTETREIQKVLTCTGMRTLKGGKLGQEWIDDDGRGYIWGKPVPGATVGARYLWTFADPEMDRAYVDAKSAKGPRYQGMTLRAEDERIAVWESEHYAAKALFAQRGQARKEQTSDLVDTLRPYRDAYRKLAFPEQRAAYLATIIRAITG